jgi:chromate transporter
VFSQIALFFSKMAVVTFGGAYAVLAYVAQQAVDSYRLAQARRDARRARHGRDHAGAADHGHPVRRLHGRLPHPGGLPPLLAGTLGGLLATWVTFTPCFLWIFLGAPFVERLRGNKALSARSPRSPPPWSA